MKLNVFDESWRQSQAAEYDADPLNPEKARGYLLVVLSDALETENRIENGHIFCPEFNITITPSIGKITDKNALINYVLYAPQWGRELYETSIGMADTAKQAMQVANESFMFTFLNAVIKMEKDGEKRADENIATIFAGKTRNWNVYFSDVAATGDAPSADAGVYWDRLKKLIIKRLGNQKLSYVKIYVARSDKRISVECRVDGIISAELSRAAAKMAEQWKTDGFASHQMFFCIRQDDATVTEYPYLGLEGKAEFKRKVKDAVELFAAADTDEKRDSLLSDTKEKLKDDILAIECFIFLPEICAENAFPQIEHAESVNIALGGRKEKNYYKSQLADYWPLRHTVMELFNEGAFGSDTRDIYKRYVEKSAILNMISQLREKEAGPRNIKMNPLQFQIEEEFGIR